MSLLPSVLLQVCSTSNNTCRWQREIFSGIACGNDFINVRTQHVYLNMWAKLNDALLNLVHQETQGNRLGEQIQSSATYHQSSSRLQKILTCGICCFIAALKSKNIGFCWAVQKVKSTFDWSIAVQIGINMHSWYIINTCICDPLSEFKLLSSS